MNTTSEALDIAALRADDAYVEQLRAGHAPAGDVLAQMLLAWRAETNGPR